MAAAMSKPHITAIAIKEPGGRVVKGAIGKRHDDLNTRGVRGFITDKGAFVRRTEASRIARGSGQTTVAGPLHSHQLKKVKR